MSWLSSFLHPGRAYEKAGNEYQKHYNEGQGYLQPYNENGQQAYGNLSGAMENLLNPQDLYNEWASGYQTSPAAQNAQGRAREQGAQAASSMGIFGSTPALQSIQAGTSQIGAEDFDRYMDNLMQKYVSGAQLAQGIYGQGGQAGNAMGQNANQMGQNSAQMAFGKQNAPGQMFNDLLKTGAYMFTGGMGGSPWSTGGGK